MISQLGKSTIFFALSASKYKWYDLLPTLYRLKHDGIYIQLKTTVAID